MGRSIANKKIAILDCCFSGGAVSSLTGKSGGDVEKEAEDLGSEALHKQFDKSHGSCILASSLSNRKSYQLPGKPFSAFSYYVFEGIKGKKRIGR